MNFLLSQNYSIFRLFCVVYVFSLLCMALAYCSPKEGSL